MKYLLALLISLPFHLPAVQTANSENGEVKIDGKSKLVSWDENLQRWLDLDSFWQNYAQNNNGHHWGKSEKYPPYSDVSELDTFLVQLPSGDCLMQFFHSRWRRANDVRRWDEIFNTYGGCSEVFE